MPPAKPDISVERFTVENYFNYFTEIEEHFHRRRGTTLLLSTLDWALIESWKDAGIPLQAVLRGIDATFDHWDRRPSKTRKVNGLGFCAQEVLAAAEDMKEAAVGSVSRNAETSGLPREEVAGFLNGNADRLRRATENSPTACPLPAAALGILRDTAEGLQELAGTAVHEQTRLEEMERRLTVMEGKLFAVLLASTPDETIVAMRADAERELAPYRRKMPGMQIDQLIQQYVHKRLLEQYGLPRLSLFYM
jgi:hypothetical protein